VPVPGDYDGVGHTEMAVFRTSTAQWIVNGPGGIHVVGTFGATNLSDIPVPGDYDGVGHTEMAVFRPSTGQWFVLGPGGGRLLGTFGLTNLGDIPVPGDYDGVGHTEMATFRPSTGEWFVMGPNGVRLLGNSGVAVPGDLPAGAPIGALMSQGVLKGPSAFRTSSGSGPRAASVAERSPTVILDARRDTLSSFSKPLEKRSGSTNFDAISRIRPRVHDSMRGQSASFTIATKWKPRRVH